MTRPRFLNRFGVMKKAASFLPLTASNKKNDDMIASQQLCEGSSYRCRRYVMLLRIFPSRLPRLFLIGLAVSILTTIYVRTILFSNDPVLPSPEVQSPTIVPGTNHHPRILQLGPTEIKLRHRVTGELVSFRGAGDVTTTEAVPSVLPSGEQREILERYNPMSHNAPKLKPASDMDKGSCKAMHSWQATHKPNCNVLHETSFGFEHPLGWNFEQVLAESNKFDYDKVIQERRLFSDTNEQFRLVAGGAFRWVWMIREYDGTRRALKTLRIDSKSKNFDLRNFDRHRRDAVSMDELNASPLVVNMYGFCSNSGLFDWGEGGDLSNIFKRTPDIDEEHLLRIAYNVSLAIHDAHHFDSRGRATIAHTDIKPDQFLFQDGYYRLTDFNRVRFLLWNHAKNSPCGFKVPKNGGIWRAPEEYAYQVESEKVDVYSLGNVLYFLLTKEYPWMNASLKEVYRKVQDGERPQIRQNILNSDSIFDRYMIDAINMAWTHDQYQRPSAFELAQKLKEGIRAYEALEGKR